MLFEPRTPWLQLTVKKRIPPMVVNARIALKRRRALNIKNRVARPIPALRVGENFVVERTWDAKPVMLEGPVV
jgi:hypothetical protein